LVKLVREVFYQILACG